jgi:hypothetical protein
MFNKLLAIVEALNSFEDKDLAKFVDGGKI